MQLVRVTDENYVVLMDDTTCELRSDMKVPGGKVGEEIKKLTEAEKDAKVSYN